MNIYSSSHTCEVQSLLVLGVRSLRVRSQELNFIVVSNKFETQECENLAHYPNKKPVNCVSFLLKLIVREIHRSLTHVNHYRQ